MAAPYTSVSFWNPQDQQKYDQLSGMANAVQQGGQTPVDPNGQASWTQGLSQLGSALLAAQMRQRAQQLQQQRAVPQWAGADIPGANA